MREKDKYDHIYAHKLTYDNKQLYGSGYHASKIIDYIDALTFHTILDIGCGRGQFAQALVKRGKKVWAVDISEVLIDELNQDTHDNITYKCASQDSLPFDAKFDLVASIGVLEHSPVDLIDKSIAELARLAQNDVITLVGWNKDESFRMTLHMTIRDKSWWTNKFAAWFPTIKTIKDIENGVFLHLQKGI